MAGHLLGSYLDRGEADCGTAIYALRGPRVWCCQRRSGGAHRPDGARQLLVRRPATHLARPSRRGVDEIIEQVRAAVASYPYPNTYRAWPGPNSNTFLAYIARQVPGLGIDLPSNAVGKDFLPGAKLFAAAPSGSGFQVSLYGVAGILAAAKKGIEMNLLGLSLGVDPVRPALKLPALGRLGLQRLSARRIRGSAVVDNSEG